MAAKKKKAESAEDAKYGALARELDEILGGIEEGEIDIDDLSTKVERATELIRMCREKLDATQIRVQKVVATLGEDDDEEEAWEETEEDDDDDDSPPF